MMRKYNIFRPLIPEMFHGNRFPPGSAPPAMTKMLSAHSVRSISIYSSTVGGWDVVYYKLLDINHVELVIVIYCAVKLAVEVDESA